MKLKRTGLLWAAGVIALLVVVGIVLHLPSAPGVMGDLHDAVHGTSVPTGGSDEAGPVSATGRARDGVRQIGSRWDEAALAETVALYAPIQRELDWPGLLPIETIRYGAGDGQTFELYRPEQEFSEPGPVFVFTHARETESNTVSYAHVGKLAATFGGIGVTLGYSNGPAASLTAAADDLSLVLEWLAENIAGYGGDPATLVLVAHSGGAMPAAAWLFGKGRQLPEGSGVAAAILSSGRFGELAPRILEVADAYDGEPVPLALWTAEYDPPEVAADVAALYALLCRKYDDCPWFEQIPGHNHLSQILSLGTDDSDVVNRLIRFYHTVR